MTDNISSNKRIAKNSILLSLRMIVVLGISLYTTRALLGILGVVDYGVYNVVCGFVTMFTFLNTSMSNGVQRFYNYEYGKNGVDGANKVFCTSVYIQFFLALVIIILVEPIGLWYLHNKMVLPDNRISASNWIFQFAVISFVVGIMRAPFSAAVTAHERFDFFAIMSIMFAIAKLLVVFAIKIIPSDNLIEYGFLLLLTSILEFIIYIFYCKKNFKEIRFNRGLNMVCFKEMLGFSGWNLFGSLSGVMKEQGINLVINLFFGPIVNAARGVAAQVNSGIQGFVGNILTPVRPQVIQSYAIGDVHRTMNLTYSISKISSCFFLMMAIPISMEIDFVLKLWLGDTVPNHTNNFTIIVLATSLVNILNGAVSTVVHATGKMMKYQIWSSLSGIASVPIAFALLKVFKEPEIAMITVFACVCVGQTISLFILRELVGMRLTEYIQRVLIPIAVVFSCSFLAILPIKIFMVGGMLRFVIICVVSIMSVSLSLFFLGLMKNERELFIQIINKYIKWSQK